MVRRWWQLFPVYGYADETLMKDMRFKLGHALRNAGLNGTEYARDILTDKCWGGPSRPDAAISNIPGMPLGGEPQKRSANP